MNASGFVLLDNWEERFHLLTMRISGQLLEEQRSDILTSSAITAIENGQRLNKVGQNELANNYASRMVYLQNPVVPSSLPPYENLLYLKCMILLIWEVNNCTSHLERDFIGLVCVNILLYLLQIVRFVSLCKTDNTPPTPPLIPFHVAQSPMEFISIDIQCIPPDDYNFKYLLLIGYI